MLRDCAPRLRSSEVANARPNDEQLTLVRKCPMNPQIIFHEMGRTNRDKLIVRRSVPCCATRRRILAEIASVLSLREFYEDTNYINDL